MATGLWALKVSLLDHEKLLQQKYTGTIEENGHVSLFLKVMWTVGAVSQGVYGMHDPSLKTDSNHSKSYYLFEYSGKKI